MILHNFVTTKVPKIPDILKNKLTFVANFKLNDNEVHIFGLALIAIAEQLKKDNITNQQLTNVNVIFTKNGSFSMEEETNTTFGLHFSLAIYAIENLRKINNERFMLFTFVEELVHHYWCIENETNVKYKVLEVVQLIDSNITLQIVKGWGVNGL